MTRELSLALHGCSITCSLFCRRCRWTWWPGQITCPGDFPWYPHSCLSSSIEIRYMHTQQKTLQSCLGEAVQAAGRGYYQGGCSLQPLHTRLWWGKASLLVAFPCFFFSAATDHKYCTDARLTLKLPYSLSSYWYPVRPGPVRFVLTLYAPEGMPLVNEVKKSRLLSDVLSVVIYLLDPSRKWRFSSNS